MMPPPNLQAYLDQLGRAHGFDREQLAMNRAGRVHPSQAARGKRSGIGCGVFLVLLALLVLAGGTGGAAALYSDLREPISRVDMNGVYALAAAGVLLSLVFAAIAVSQFLSVGRRRGQYATGGCGLAEGPLFKTRVRHSRNPDTYHVEVGGLRFTVGQALFDLVTQGARYRVYHVAGDLLSLEPG
jgi:hypothetical protein